MKRFLLSGISLFILFVLAQYAIGQVTMPAAITIEPANATGWDEITLTLDPSKACVPDGKQSVAGAAVVKMHSAAFLYDNIDNWPGSWGNPGVDYDATPKDGIHDAPDLLPNGDGTYSITFTPGDFYGVETGSTIIGITAVFNAGTWNNEAKDFADDGCGDFYIPLTYADPTPALKFKLDLTYQEELGNFNKDGGKAYVIVDGTEYEMDQLLEGLFPVAKYEKTLKEGIVADQSYTYKFKMDDAEETVADRSVTAAGYQKVLSHFFNNEEPPVTMGTITFNVDMRYYMREDKFDPATQYVDLAGTLNDWDGTNHHLSDADADSIYSITVDSLDIYDKIAFKFRIDGSWEAGQHDGGSDRIVMVRPGTRSVTGILNHYRPGWVPVTLAVNMYRALDVGLFDPDTNYVDVAGSMNNWSGSTDLVGDGNDSIFITNPPILAPANDTIEYKFRINSSWDAGKHDSGDNRKFVVADTTGGVVNAADTVWFDHIPLFIEPFRTLNIQEVTIFPNPADEILYIENAFEIETISIINIVGQEVRNIHLNSRFRYELNTSELEQGIYILSVHGKNGYKGTAKFIKK